ncbi:hypothetical protein [Methylobacterium nigriterrae]|uniref:hypothetical protein n=1 Tax=Methylobacterium nigriterrae TaxID=3127512 RepID=UPI0030138603
MRAAFGDAAGVFRDGAGRGRRRPDSGPVVAFSLGTTLAMWDGVAARLRGCHRVLRDDTRGHGASATRDAAAEITGLAKDLHSLAAVGIRG